MMAADKRKNVHTIDLYYIFAIFSTSSTILDYTRLFSEAARERKKKHCNKNDHLRKLTRHYASYNLFSYFFLLRISNISGFMADKKNVTLEQRVR